MKSNGKKIKRKNRIRTLGFREIRFSFPRFISLLIISMLGVFCFAGLQATSPDMIQTLNQYVTDTNLYDLKLVSTAGFEPVDMDAISKLTGVDDIEGTYSNDLLIPDGKTEYVVKALSLPNNINTITLLKGRMPKENNEVLVESNFLDNTTYSIGDSIPIDSDNMNDKSLVIVGTVRSPLYFGNNSIKENLGKTTVGAGTVNYFLYAKQEIFKLDYYTELYLKVSETSGLTTRDDKYNHAITTLCDRINAMKGPYQRERYQSLYDDTKAQIHEEELLLNAQLKKAKKKLDGTGSKLTATKKYLDSTWHDLDMAKDKVDFAKNQYKKALKKYNLKETDLGKALKKAEDAFDKANSALDKIPKDTDPYKEAKKTKNQLRDKRNALGDMVKTRDFIKSGSKAYKANLKSYKSARKKYIAARKKYNAKLADYYSTRAEKRSEITDAKEELSSLLQPDWYMYTRADMSLYKDFYNDADSIANLSLIFPIVFFAVAILISLISMSRMVEDDRGEIGTLKSMGFTNRKVRSKYIRFSFIAVLTGGVIGALLGVVIIPNLIWNIYKIIFDIPGFTLSLNWRTALIGLAIAFLCVLWATSHTVKKVIKENTASLLRSKAPKKGKRVWLEHIPFIWKHLKFTRKVIIRNIARYKKRVCVTIFGITGCTALLLCGFGLRDSIVDIPKEEYQTIFQYDNLVHFASHTNKKEIADALNHDEITSYVNAYDIAGTVADYDVTMVIPENKTDMDKIVSLQDVNTGAKLTLKKNEVVITDKLASLLHLSVGGTIDITDTDNHNYRFTISGICKNYVGHYLYMSKETFGTKSSNYAVNVSYLSTTSMTGDESDDFLEDLLTDDNIISATSISDFVENADNMLHSLNSVVIILIVLAALLSFVVLYNLSTMNISERKYEIATLKVLGFYNREVDTYITSENAFITIIGIALGLFLGYYLTGLVVSTVEIENVRFIHNISSFSYIISGVMAACFTGIINLTTHFALKRIYLIY